MQYKDAAIESTVYFWFAANTVLGDAGDGASPLFDVRLAGAAAAAAPVLEGTPTLLTHANYSAGVHEIAVAATAANGFAAGNEYAVFCTLTISTVNPSGFVGSFRLTAAGKTVLDAAARTIDEITVARLGALTDWINGGRLDLLLDAVKAITDQFVFTVANKVDSNTLLVVGSAPETSGDIAGAVWDRLLTAITAAGSIGKLLKDCVVSLAIATGAVVDDAANSETTFETDLASAVNDYWKDALLLFTSGTLAGQVKKITAYTGATKFVTCGAFTAEPTAGDAFVLINR
jgi:hypothetical protein